MLCESIYYCATILIHRQEDSADDQSEPETTESLDGHSSDLEETSNDFSNSQQMDTTSVREVCAVINVFAASDVLDDVCEVINTPLPSVTPTV